MNLVSKSTAILKSAIVAAAAISGAFLYGEEPKADWCTGKVDIGPTYMHLELFEYGKKTKKMDLYGYRADACWVSNSGYAIKPVVMMGWGGGDLYNLSLSVGRCIPFGKYFILAPNVGFAWCYVITEIDIPFLQLDDVEEKFRSTTPFMGLDIICNFASSWRACLTLQYGWSHSSTKIGDFAHSDLNSNGPNIGLMIEHDLNDCWSINLGLGYNDSMSKERHGLKAKGAKLGIVHWF